MARQYITPAGFVHETSDREFIVNGVMLSETSPVAAGTQLIYVNVAGTWKQATVFVKNAGVWKQPTVYVKHSGVWKQP